MQEWRSPHPLPTCKPAGGAEEVEKPGRRSLGGREVCWAFGKKFLERWGFHFQQGVYFHHLCARGWSGKPMFQLLAEMNGKRQFGESESVSYCLFVIILLFLRFGDQCLKRCWTRKYSQINVLYCEASRSSLDQLE